MLGPQGTPSLSHHTGDVARVGGQQDGVGVLGQFRECADVLLGHSQLKLLHLRSVATGRIKIRDHRLGEEGRKKVERNQVPRRGHANHNEITECDSMEPKRQEFPPG